MIATYVGIAITVLAIQIDKWTRCKFKSLPYIAFAGVVTVIWSLVAA